MYSTLNAVAKTLASVAGLSKETQAEILHALVRDRHVVTEGMHASASDSDSLHQVSDTGFVKLQTPLEASADQKNLALLRQVTAMARRLGVSFDPDRVVSMTSLDEQLRGKEVLLRLQLKQGMAALGLIA
jgi:hypothetical protein